MLRTHYLLVVIFILILGCAKEPELVIAAESFSEKDLPLCQDVSCPEISIDYIKLAGVEEATNKINAAIRSFIIESLYLGDAAMPATATTIDEAATQFIEMYRTHNAEFPDMQMEYFADIDIHETFVSEKLLSLEMHHYLFTGGAHGYGATYFANFDPATGMEIPMEDLFEEYETFKKFAEAKFRAANDIPANGPINATWFWFEDDTFYLPETIGFTETSMILIYNQYEITSYAAGPVELQIPMIEVNPYVSKSLK